MRSTDATMPVTLWPADSEPRPVIQQLAQFYRHDMEEWAAPSLVAADLVFFRRLWVCQLNG